MDLTQAIYDALSGDATLVALLATYGSDSPPAPAIFTSWPVPANATRPYIVSAGETGVSNFDELAPTGGESPPTHLGLDALRDVHCYADNDGSASTIEAIARRIRKVLHRTALTVPNGSHIMTQCVSGPVLAPTDDSLVGRMLTFRIVAMEK